MLTQTVDAPESINHLFVHCQYAQDVWRAAPFTTDGDNRLGRVLAGGVLETLFTAYGHHHKPPRTVDSMGISASPPTEHLSKEHRSLSAGSLVNGATIRCGLASRINSSWIWLDHLKT